jgi:copper transport protein
MGVSPMHGLRGCTFVLLIALSGAMAHAPPASAHASLVGSQPPEGATLADAPANLRLEFNEPVSPLVVRLIGPDGQAVTPAVKAENNTLTIVPPQLAGGSHVLSWRVVSADGHPVGGALSFSVGAPSTRPALAALDTDPAVKAAIWAARLWIYLGLFVGVGGASFIAVLAQARLPGRTQGCIAGIMLGGLMAAVLSLGLQGLDALALPLTQLRRPDVWTSGLATSYGWTALVAAAAQLLGLVSLRATSAAAVGLCASCALAGAGLALALSGHAATAEPAVLSRPAVFLHGICVAFWLGSLIPLWAIVRDRGRGDGELAG